MEKQLMSISDSLVNKQTFLEIQECNEETLEYGLKLSDEDIRVILKTRNNALRSNGRFEFGGVIVKKIISAFCESPYISQYNYLETIDELIDIFYFYKNETMDEISDDELIDLMKNYFDNECQGSLELLSDRYLYNVAHNIKFGVNDFAGEDEMKILEEYFSMEGDEE
ncbi:DUF6323 family protein [Clostridium paridis]|uniref:Uncharacterized protein n=1 Tax=Clostridium paridis TaxID=2803863 RepID=A0A937K4T9_9CLOT|nr:DUF6323 family protein [Clostridium paridis]MBL4931873.1 hypothetical protein [Clostridium paridis]